MNWVLLGKAMSHADAATRSRSLPVAMDQAAQDWGNHARGHRQCLTGADEFDGKSSIHNDLSTNRGFVGGRLDEIGVVRQFIRSTRSGAGGRRNAPDSYHQEDSRFTTIGC